MYFRTLRTTLFLPSAKSAFLHWINWRNNRAGLLLYMFRVKLICRLKVLITYCCEPLHNVLKGTWLCGLSILPNRILFVSYLLYLIECNVLYIICLFLMDVNYSRFKVQVQIYLSHAPPKVQRNEFDM